jgi:hypothetical protein
MGNADTEPVEFLALFGPEGQRAHLRARPLRAGGTDPQKSRPEG